MRHAKSSWAIPGARDFDRELNDRGVADAIKIGKALAAKGFLPQKVLCSSAVRTRETLDNIIGSFETAPQVTYTDKLYSSGLSDYVEMIQAEAEPVSIMVIGHNPMCGALAASMPGSGNEEAISKIAYKYPTAAVSIIDFDIERWSDVAQRTGIMVDCLIPSEL